MECDRNENRDDNEDDNDDENRESTNVSSSRTTIISGLRLGNMNLRGTIPNEIRLLSSLTRVDLSNNEIRGTIPGGLYEGCVRLRGLFLEHNMLTGSLSSSSTKVEGDEGGGGGGGAGAGIGNLIDLERLYLGNNRFGGTIPGEEMDRLND